MTCESWATHDWYEISWAPPIEPPFYASEMTCKCRVCGVEGTKKEWISYEWDHPISDRTMRVVFGHSISWKYPDTISYIEGRGRRERISR